MYFLEGMRRRGVKGPKQRRKATRSWNPILKGLQLFFQLWLLVNVSDRVTGVGMCCGKWLKQWLWFHGDDTVAPYLSCCFQALSRAGFLFGKTRLNRQNAAPPLQCPKRIKTATGDFWWAPWHHPCPRVREWEAQTHDHEKYTCWRSQLPGIIGSASRHLFRGQHPGACFLYSPRAKNVHLFKKL